MSTVTTLSEAAGSRMNKHTWGHSIEPTSRKTRKCKQKGCFKRHECIVRFRIGKEGRFEERLIRFCWEHGRAFLAGQRSGGGG